MSLSAWIPARQTFVRSVAVILAVAVPIGLIWWLAGGSVALSVWLGIVAMFIAVLHLPLRRQLVIGLLIGAGAGAGALSAGNTPILVVVIAAACLVQSRFNQWSIASAAMLPPMVIAHTTATELAPLQVVAATWLGVAIVILMVALAGLDSAERPAAIHDAARHAVVLTAGCVALVLLITAFDLPRGFWAVLTLCLVFRPTRGETRTKVWQRVLGTVVGGALTVAIGAVAPLAVVVVLTVACGVLTTAYALTNDYLRYVIFLTCGLLFGAGAGRLDVVLVEERVGMTVLGGVLAMALTGLLEIDRRNNFD